MQVVQLHQLDLMEFTQGDAPGNAVRAAWPVYRDSGATSTAAVCVELDPGMHLPRHTDSTEELIVVLEGEIEVTIGSDRMRLAPGGLVLIPTMVPHEASNAGDRLARFVGVFGSNTIVSVFDAPFEQTGGRVVGTPAPGAEAAAA